MTVRALRSTAQRIRLLAAEAAELRTELDRLVAAIAPWLLIAVSWPMQARMMAVLKR